MDKTKRNDILTLLLFFVIPLLFFLVLSRNSFLSEMNTREDINCFINAGQYILNGKIPYRDFFDHKGPIVYYLYAFFLLICPHSFHGAYIFEVICGFLYCVCSYKTITLFIKNNRFASIALTLVAFFCGSFTANGDNGQFEQFVLPALALVVHVSAKYILTRERISRKVYFAVGLLAGFIFWAKYTILSVFLICIISLIIVFILDKQYKQIANMCIFGLLGFLFVTGIVIGYFAAAGCLSDLISVYFTANFSQYTDEIMLYPGHRIRSILVSSLLGIMFYVFGAIYGFMLLTVVSNRKKHKSKQVRQLVLFAMMGYIATILCVCIGGYAFAYYFLIMAAWYPLILALFSEYRNCVNVSLYRIIAISSLVLFALYSFVFGFTYVRDSETRANLHAFQERAVAYAQSTDHPTMCCFNYPEDGYFFTAGELPDMYYYTCASARRDEIVQTYIDDVLAGKIGFVFVYINTEYDDTDNIRAMRLLEETHLQEVDRFDCGSDIGGMVYMYENLDAI